MLIVILGVDFLRINLFLHRYHIIVGATDVHIMSVASYIYTEVV